MLNNRRRYASANPGDHPRTIIAAILVIGVAVAIVLCWRSFMQEQARVDSAFYTSAHEHGTAIERSWRQRFDSVHAIADLFQASRFVTRAEFSQVARSILRRYDGIYTLEWVPRVPAIGRETFVARARGDIPDFAIRDTNDQGELVAVKPRPVYYPILYVEPLDKNQQVLGYDPENNPARTSALHTAIINGELTVSAATSLLQTSARRGPALLVFVPVDEREDGSSIPRLKGLAEGTFIIRTLVTEAVSVLNSNGLRLSITDRTADTGHPIHEIQPPATPMRWYQWPGAQTYDYGWTLGGRMFAAHIAASGSRFAYDLRGPMTIFALALGLTALAAWLVAVLLRRERNIRRLAQRRSDQLLHLSQHDPLTGLLNRSGFQHRLEKALSEAQADDTRIASLCFLDLDQFKLINDVCGHGAGDKLLQQLTARLTSRLTASDTIARLGGDEFGLLLGNCTAEEAASTAKIYLEHIEATRFTWGENVFPITASAGIIEINARTQSIATAMSQADVACYIAKERGRNRLHVFYSGDEVSNTFHQQMNWVARIRGALEDERLTLFQQSIQPCRGNARGRSSGVFREVLLRLREHDGTLTLPGAFLPAAERYGLMPGIDRWVASHLISALEAHKLGNDVWFVNLSGETLGDLTFCDFIMHCLHRHRIPAQALCFEITETAVVSNVATARVFIERLRALGCRFALDDFGSGMSSFSYLRELPVDFLKIEGTFIRGMPNGTLDRAIVGAIKRLADELGLYTIAEFVENEAIHATVRELGIDYAQGYLIERPTPLADALRDDPRVQLTLVHGWGTSGSRSG